MQKITPFLWFDNQAEEAMNFYTSIFSAVGGSASGGKNSKIGKISRWGEGGPGPKGTVMSATVQLDGQDFMALNGGPMFKFTEAEKSKRVMMAMLQMDKIDMQQLQRAYDDQ